MKMRHLIISLIFTIIAGKLAPPIADEMFAVPNTDTPAQGFQDNLTCSQPSGDNATICQQMEAQILAATVQIRIDTWVVKDEESGYDIDHSYGHATLIAGRYLVTHNHFSVPLSIRPRDGDPNAYGVVTLSNSKGQLLYQGSLNDFQLIQEDPATLVMMAKDDRLFARLGLRSAAFLDWSTAPLEPGMEVAQVNWDGYQTRVDWTAIQEIEHHGGASRLDLANEVMPGASGGGIFWYGIHVANNWSLVQQFDESGALLNVHSTAALNGTAFK